MRLARSFSDERIAPGLDAGRTAAHTAGARGARDDDCEDGQKREPGPRCQRRRRGRRSASEQTRTTWLIERCTARRHAWPMVDGSDGISTRTPETSGSVPRRPRRTAAQPTPRGSRDPRGSVPRLLRSVAPAAGRVAAGRPGPATKRAAARTTATRPMRLRSRAAEPRVWAQTGVKPAARSRNGESERHDGRSLVIVPAWPGQLTCSELIRQAEADLRPRTDYVELARALDADVMDIEYMRRRATRTARLIEQCLGVVPAQVAEAFLRRRRFRHIVVRADRLGLPLALLLKLARSRRDLVLISAWLSPSKKAFFLDPLRVHSHLKAIVNYS